MTTASRSPSLIRLIHLWTLSGWNLSRADLSLALGCLSVEWKGDSTNAPIERILGQHDYDARVLGGGRIKLTEATWCAEVIAIPKERVDLLGSLERMANWSLRE